MLRNITVLIHFWLEKQNYKLRFNNHRKFYITKSVKEISCEVFFTAQDATHYMMKIENVYSACCL